MNLSTTERSLLLTAGVVTRVPEPAEASHERAEAPGFFQRFNAWIERERAGTLATERDRRFAETRLVSLDIRP